MESKPLVSIILVNYNGMKDTVDCVKSIKENHYNNYNIIVIDNGSTEHTEDSMLQYIKKNSEYIRLEQNLGFSGGNNVGIQYAQEKFNPDYVLLLNNDTTVDTYFLINLIEAEKRYPHCLLTGKIYYHSDQNRLWFAGGEYDRKTSRTIHYGFNEADNGDYDESKEISFATGCLMFIPKEVLNKAGLLSEEFFLYYEDTDYCCKVIDSGFKIIYCPDCIIYHKVSVSTKKNSPLQNYYMIRNSLYIVDKYNKKSANGCHYIRMYYLKKVIKRECQLKILFKAFKDYRKRVMGKAEI